MDNQQPHGYMRTPPPPPPPLKADPYQRPSPSVPTRPPANRWPYSATQFQYQPQTQHSPSPPPPQWPPPQSSDHAPYPPHYSVHQPPPYPAHPHYPPPQPLPPRPPPAPPFYTQDWESSWTQRNWQYPTNNIEEDWGAKAKAWLAAKATTENQNPSPQIVSGGGTEGKYQYSEQYSQANDPHTPLASISNYQLYPGAVGPQNQAGVCQTQESQYTSAGQSSYVADMHVAFAARDGSNGGDSVTSINPLVHQQEVPSSYSSVAGNEEVGDRYEKYNSFSPQTVGPLPHQHVQPLPPGQAGWMEGPHNFGSMPKETPSDLRDQPLNFALFTHNLDPHAQPHCDISSGGSVRDGEPTVAVSSNYAWPSCTAPGAAYPPVAPSIPLVSQVDHPIALPSLASGHLSPMFPTGPAFQPTVTTMGAAFGVGVGVTPPPTAIFGDAYGVSERPKKASVPNWLKEEIIKNKAVIASSTIEIPKDDPQSIEEDSSFDKSSKKGYQGDSKSIDSSRSAEDEDEDEDEIEAARTAAINQEIKRVLTEVLMKVTDELFDEIATKVLNEDNLSVEVGCDVGLSSHQILLSKQSVSTPKASAKILVPIMTKESGYGDASEQSTSSPPGDVLGLGSYASDEEDEDKQSNSKEISNHLQPSSCKPFKGNSVNDNGFPMEATEEQSFPAKLDADSICIKSPVSVTPDGSVANMELSDFKEPGEFASNDDGRSSKRFSRITQEELQHGPDISTVNNSLDKRVVEKNKDDNLYAEKMANDDSKIQETGRRYVKNVTLGNKKCSFKEDHKDSKSSKERLEKGNEEQGRHLRTERMDYHNTSKDKDKEKSKTNGKVKNCLLEKGNEEQGRHLRTERMDYHNNSKDESRKRSSPLGGKEGNIETRSDSRASGKKNSDRREDRTRNEIRERSRHKTESESSRHKRRRSPSVGFKDRDSKDNSLVNRANDSGEESSDDSRRKSHHLKRRKSPSPVRSRKRHVSRSPHSKHSKRRHSPYSYLDTARRKRSASRSRSRSPIHRRR